MSSYASGSIAGIQILSGGDDCQLFILDGGNLMPDHIGVTRFAADGTAYTQTLAAPPAAFGVKAAFIPADVLGDVLTAINAAMNGGAGFFNVNLTDEIQSIDADCEPDYSANWITIEEQRTDSRAVKNVVFRFIRL